MAGVSRESSERLPKSCRIRAPAAYAAVFKQGQKNQDALFTVFVAPGAASCVRVGVVVSRKVSHKAVARNRIKRQIRESFRRNRRVLAGLDLVVIARPAAADGTGPKLRAALEQHWEKITRKCKKF